MACSIQHGAIFLLTVQVILHLAIKRKLSKDLDETKLNRVVQDQGMGLTEVSSHAVAMGMYIFHA